MAQELYELPAGWEWLALNKVVEKTANLNPSQKPDSSWDYIDISSIDRDKLLITEPKKVIGKEAPSRAKKQVQVGDVIFATTRPNLKNIAVIKKEYELAVASTGFSVLRASNKLDSKYLFYFVTTNFLQQQIEPFISGASYPAITDTNLKKAFIPLPALAEQQRLVKKLDTLFSRINTAIEHLELSLELNDQLFASSLNQAFNPLDAEVQPDGTYQLPEGWEWNSIEDVARVGAERGFVPDVDENDMAVFVSMADIDQDTGLNSSYERRDFETIKTGYTKFQKNAVLLAKITPCTENNKTALVMHESGGYATTEVYPIHASEKLTSHYLLHFLRSSTPRELLISKMEGATGRQRVPTKAVKEIMMPVCSLNEQAKINGFISSLQEKTQANKQVLQQKLEQLQQLKASLLDSAFRGDL